MGESQTLSELTWCCVNPSWGYIWGQKMLDGGIAEVPLVCGGTELESRNHEFQSFLLLSTVWPWAGDLTYLSVFSPVNSIHYTRLLWRLYETPWHGAPIHLLNIQQVLQKCTLELKNWSTWPLWGPLLVYGDCTWQFLHLPNASIGVDWGNVS